jgi:beta-galactosidase
VPRFVPKGQKALVEWEFSKDGSTWETVTVPHSYNAVDGRSAKYYRGPATYRRSIDIKDPAKPAYLLLEGAAQAATVRVNGQEACVHKGGYTAFSVDLTGLLKKGANTVEVVCDNTEDIEMIPVSSDFNKNGGLHNPAWLYVPAGIYISTLRNTGRIGCMSCRRRCRMPPRKPSSWRRSMARPMSC